MNKRTIGRDQDRVEKDPGAAWLPLIDLVDVEITSESTTHPIEGALELEAGSGWRADEPGEQLIRLKFRRPGPVRRIRLVVEERERPRTQQFVLRVADGLGGPWRDIARQQFNFSPSGATREVEDYRIDSPAVAEMELTIVPDISGGDARASLQQLRVA
jgi:hypothetical protein